MIRADDPALIALAACHHRTAMAADIGKCAKLAVLAADDDDRLVAKLQGHEIARLCDLFLTAHAVPSLHEQPLALEGEDAGVRVEGARHGTRLVVGAPGCLPHGGVGGIRAAARAVCQLSAHEFALSKIYITAAPCRKMCDMAVDSTPLRFFA